MTDKILEITKKIYNEGVEKAKSDAEKIIADAKKEAHAIVEAAKNQEAEILKKAKTQAGDIQKNTETEIKLAARQFLSRLKQQITNVVTTAQVENSAKQAFNDTDFIKNTLQTILQHWNPQKPDELNLNVLLPEQDKDKFYSYFNSKAEELLQKGVEIKFDKNTESGFKIGPKDGSYIISFSDKDFENYFKGYLKNRTRELLFDSSE